MKKVAAVGLALMLALMLVACGVPAEKKEEVREKYNQLVAMRDEFQQMIDDYQDEVGGPLPVEVGLAISELNTRLDELGNEIDNNLDRLNKQGVEDLIAHLDSEIADGRAALDEFAVQLEQVRKVTTLSTDLESKMTELAEQYVAASKKLLDANNRGVRIDKALLDEFTALGSDIQDVSLEVASKLTSLDTNDVDGAVTILEEFTTQVDELLSRNQALIDKLDALLA